VVTGKKNRQKIERGHLSLRTWCARLVRKGIRFSKDPRMHRIVVVPGNKLLVFSSGCLANNVFYPRLVFPYHAFSNIEKKVREYMAHQRLTVIIFNFTEGGRPCARLGHDPCPGRQTDCLLAVCCTSHKKS
jgi:hypothetical protein